MIAGVCNDKPNYGISFAKFKFFDRYFIANIEILKPKGVASLFVQYVIEKVFDDKSCRNLILRNIEDYASIINCVSDKFITFIGHIKDLCDKSSDDKD